VSHRLGIAVIDCINIYAVPFHRVCADSRMLFCVKTKANLYASNFFCRSSHFCILRILSRRVRAWTNAKNIRINNLKFDIRTILRARDKIRFVSGLPCQEISVIVMSNQPFKARNAFHPADPPHGMQNYDLGALTRDQKQALNKMKMVTRKENEIYLKSHPEIRGFISILLRYTCLIILYNCFRKKYVYLYIQLYY